MAPRGPKRPKTEYPKKDNEDNQTVESVFETNRDTMKSQNNSIVSNAAVGLPSISQRKGLGSFVDSNNNETDKNLNQQELRSVNVEQLQYDSRNESQE